MQWGKKTVLKANYGNDIIALPTSFTTCYSAAATAQTIHYNVETGCVNMYQLNVAAKLLGTERNSIEVKYIAIGY